MPVYDDVLRALSDDLERYVVQFVNGRAEERIVAFALLCSNEFASVGPIANAVATLLGDGTSAIGTEANPNEWRVFDGGDAFNASSAMLREKYEAVRGTNQFAMHQRVAFDTLVAALYRAREKNLFSQHHLLLVADSDPSELVERWMVEAVVILNEHAVSEWWIREMGFD